MPREQLDRDETPEREVGGSVEDSHSAGAQPLLDAVMREHATGERIRRRARPRRTHPRH